MKRNSMTLLLAAAMGLLAGVQTARAQVVLLHLADNQTIKYSISQLDSITFEEHDWVDLDLPSGTLWATCNVGAKVPESSGDYFAWGETEPKEDYSWSTYLHCNGDYNTMTKYCTNYAYGTVDGKTELLSEDDAATINWDNGWQIPDIEQCRELINEKYTDTRWITQNGVNGRLITSKINNNSIFLPAAGHYSPEPTDSGWSGAYWTRTLRTDLDHMAQSLFFYSDDISLEYAGRFYGQSVRPVRVKHQNDNSNSWLSIKSLWENIAENVNYSRFVDIARHTIYYKDSSHGVPTYTYEDILNGSQVNTVWIPNNDAFTEEEYEKWLQMCETDGYRVHQQFMGNHISLWRHDISGDGVETVKMVNGKSLILDKTAHTLQGIPLGTDFNKQAANGVMHVLQGVAPFRYNFYEYLKYSEPLSKFGKYVISKDTTYFSEDMSIEGMPDENGNPTYVDSVFLTTNRLFEYTSYLPNNSSDNWQMAEKGFGARINNEDSVFVMLLPTDAAWDEAYERLKESHKYAALYEDKSKGDLNSIAYLNIPVDSLQKKSIEMDIISPLVFNIHKQPKIGGELWTQEMFKTFKCNGCEYLLNTFGDTLRNVGEWDKTSLFDGELIEMSNGFAYEVSSWNFPKQYYTPDVEVEIENTGIFYNIESNKYRVGTTSKRYTFNNNTYKDITIKYGKVSNNNFFHLSAPGPSLGPRVEIKLYGNSASAYVPNAQVMSGKYDIQIVVVPHWYIDIINGLETDFMDDENANSVAASNKYKFKATLSYNNNGSKDKALSSSVIEYGGLKVDTLTLFEDFEFPYSYKNMRFTYPTLYVEGATTMNDSKNGFVYDLVIDKIILRRKD